MITKSAKFISGLLATLCTNKFITSNLCAPNGEEVGETLAHQEYCEKRRQQVSLLIIHSVETILLVYQLQQSDPMWAVELHRIVSTKLYECEHTHGPSQFQLLLQSVDWSVREQMCEYMPPEQAVKLLAT